MENEHIQFFLKKGFAKKAKHFFNLAKIENYTVRIISTLMSN